MLAERLEGKSREETEGEIAAFLEMIRGTDENGDLGDLAALKVIITTPTPIQILPRSGGLGP